MNTAAHQETLAILTARHGRAVAAGANAEAGYYAAKLEGYRLCLANESGDTHRLEAMRSAEHAWQEGG